MRLLIGSDGPMAVGRQADIRTWTQRVLWFARNGDAIVLTDAPDPAFVEHVSGLTGVDPSSLRFHLLPARWKRGNFDAWALLEGSFRDQLIEDAMSATEVIALWPCPEVGWLVKHLGVEEKLAGAAFWREGGGILANSKALFRALAGGSGTSVAPGGVCRSPEDGMRISDQLVREGHAFVVKRSFGGAGKGNEIVSTVRLAVSHAGHASTELVEATPGSLGDYWARRWAWASDEGANPFVVEAFIPDARTIYAEVECSDRGVGVGKIGELRFENGEITREVFPAQSLSASVLDELQRAASQIAQTYLAIGYRGRLSLDTVVSPAGQIFLTEANARFTTSTHLYEVIAERVARIAEEPRRIVMQALSPPSWRLNGLRSFLDGLARSGLAFNPISRTGLLAVTPPFHNTEQLLMAAIADDEEHAEELLASAGTAFSQPA